MIALLLTLVSVNLAVSVLGLGLWCYGATLNNAAIRLLIEDSWPVALYALSCAIASASALAITLNHPL